MTEDILKRAKALWQPGPATKQAEDAHDLLPELIAEVEKWKSAALDETKRRKAVAAEFGATQNEVERLRSENERLRTANASDDWGNPLVLSVSGGPYTESDRKDARIKELEALNESLMENDNDLRLRCQKAESDVKYLQDCFDLKVRSDWQQLTLYTERLEAAFLEAKKELQIYKKLCPNPSYVNASDRVDYWSEHEAREALKRIKNGA